MSAGTELEQLYAALVETEPAELLRGLVEQSGGTLLDAAKEDLGYRPGRNAHLRIAATVDRSGVVGREGWVIGAGELSGTYALESAVGRLSAWRVRDDPVLVGLRPALDVPTVGSLLTDLGVPADGLTLTLLAYRPQRRAVVKATTRSHELFLKCVPPDKAAALHRRHTVCRAAGLPTPGAVGYDAGLGLLVLTPLHGSALRTALLAETTAVLPDPDEVVALLDGFATVEIDEPARAPARQARGHAKLLRTLLPAQAGRIDDLLGRVRAVTDQDEATAVVHGDLHDDQLLVRDGRISGVVDVDGTGLGHPADDAGNLLAHLLVLRQTTPTGAVSRWLPEVRPALAARCGSDVLQARTAAVLLGLATWPHSRQLENWPARTEGILDLAESVLSGRW